MDRKRLAEKIIKEMGGKDNISQSWHCITRLRFNIVNREKINISKIKSLDGVMGVQFQSGQFQIIIGNEVANVFSEISQLLGEKEHYEGVSKQKTNVIEAVFDVISGIFTSILPAIVGGGLLKGIMALLVALNFLSQTSSNYEILSFISDAPFHFLPFLIAYSAAKKFKTDISLSITLAGVLMYPKIMEYAAGGEISYLSFIGLKIPMNSYSSSVLPIILGVWLLSYVYKGVDKIVPKSLRIVFVPLLVLLIIAPITLMFIAPLGTYIGVYLDILFTKLFDFAGPVAGLLMGGLMPLIVITGMHYAFFPGTFASFHKFGYDIMLLPMNLVANLAQAGATLGVFIKIKDPKMKQLSFSTFIPAVFGITEPAIYGVTMKLKKPFYASLIGGAVGGAIFGIFSVKAFSFTVPGIMSVPSYIENGSNNFIYALIGVVSSFIVSLVITLMFKFESKEDERIRVTDNVSTIESDNNIINLLSPLTGDIIPLEDIPDSTFAEGIVGNGVAIIPKEGIVYSPFSGEVTMLTPNNHAIGITSDTGVELLIHIGLETVSLKGEGFKLKVKKGEKIEIGDELLEFDIDGLKEKDVSLVSPVIVTNTPEYLDIIHTDDKHVDSCKSKLLMIIK